MIQDIFPHVFYNQYDPEAIPQPEDYVLCFEDRDIALRSDRKAFLRVSDFPAGTPMTYLFRVDESRFFLAEMPENCSRVNVMALRREGGMERPLIFAALTGKHLADWYWDSRFCGRCGGRMIHSPTERAMRCPACEKNFYPRIMPAVIVGVRNGGSLLLTQYRTGFAHNALIAGFTEIGETMEETVAREVMEEAGVKVKNIRYYKSQPWGIANDILAGYYCDLDGDPTIHMDANELKVAHWVPREEIVLQPDDFSLTNEMMKMFKEGKQ